jgi:hypothetical protein
MDNCRLMWWPLVIFSVNNVLGMWLYGPYTSFTEIENWAVLISILLTCEFVRIFSYVNMELAKMLAHTKKCWRE